MVLKTRGAFQLSLLAQALNIPAWGVSIFRGMTVSEIL
jgi:hypothetical protein